jgi:uncharacterized protein (DUF2141 family)
MNLWVTFWGVWLLLSGIAFALITVIVAVRGFKDLKFMFEGLRAHQGKVDGKS